MDDMGNDFVSTNDLLAAIGFLFAAGAIVSAVMVAQAWWERLNTPGALAHDGPRPADYAPGTLPTHSVTGETSAQETQPLLQSVLLPQKAPATPRDEYARAASWLIATTDYEWATRQRNGGTR